MPVKRPRFKIDWASLILGRNLPFFFLFVFVLPCIWGKFPRTSPPGGGRGGCGLILEEGRFNRRLFAYEFGGLISRILWYVFLWLKQAYSWPATDFRLMERKLSLGLWSPSLISFNNNAIVWNFYPTKFHSSKLFKDWPPIWREFAYDHLWL